MLQVDGVTVVDDHEERGVAVMRGGLFDRKGAFVADCVSVPFLVFEEFSDFFFLEVH